MKYPGPKLSVCDETFDPTLKGKRKQKDKAPFFMLFGLGYHCLIFIKRLVV